MLKTFYYNIGVFFVFVMFFVTLFRLSFLQSGLYLAFIPAGIGFLLFFSQSKLYKGILLIKKKDFYPLLSAIFLFFYCLFLDSFQPILTAKSSFALRVLLIGLLSFLPAYAIYMLAMKNNKQELDRFFKWAVIMQIIFFFVMFLNNNLKIMLYSIFGMGETNLNEFNLSTRGFGLSAEINFMTPFLLIFMSFLLFRRDIILKIIVSLTQIVNSNMAVGAILLGYFISKGGVINKVALLVAPLLIFFSFGEEFIKAYMPRLYDEYIVHGGGRTVDALFDKHFFLLDNLDLASSLFGFQVNVATNVGFAERGSDMGWVVMMNYGGGILILLFLCFIVSLSFAIFKNKLYAFAWIVIALLFNTKGMIIGMNGYFFLSFLLLLTKRFYDEGDADVR